MTFFCYFGVSTAAVIFKLILTLSFESIQKFSFFKIQLIKEKKIHIKIIIDFLKSCFKHQPEFVKRILFSNFIHN